EIVASPHAQVGSIGTYLVVQDWSALFERAGVKTHVVRAGAFKGAGAFGAEVTEEQLQEFQRVVNSINEGFVASVGRGRRLGIERARELADGRLWSARKARELGLVDRVASFDRAFSDARLGKVGT